MPANTNALAAATIEAVFMIVLPVMIFVPLGARLGGSKTNRQRSLALLAAVGRSMTLDTSGASRPQPEVAKGAAKPTVNNTLGPLLTCLRKRTYESHLEGNGRLSVALNRL